MHTQSSAATHEVQTIFLACMLQNGAVSATEPWKTSRLFVTVWQAQGWHHLLTIDTHPLVLSFKTYSSSMKTVSLMINFKQWEQDVPKKQAGIAICPLGWGGNKKTETREREVAQSRGNVRQDWTKQKQFSWGHTASASHRWISTDTPTFPSGGTNLLAPCCLQDHI